jgi:hypothetical protein
MTKIETASPAKREALLDQPRKAKAVREPLYRAAEGK